MRRPLAPEGRFSFFPRPTAYPKWEKSTATPPHESSQDINQSSHADFAGPIQIWDNFRVGDDPIGTAQIGYIQSGLSRIRHLSGAKESTCEENSGTPVCVA